MTRLNATILMILAFATMFDIHFSHAQGQWTTPVELAENSNAMIARAPALAVAPDGTLHMLWCGQALTENENLLVSSLFYRTLSRTGWSPAVSFFTGAAISRGDVISLSSFGTAENLCPLNSNLTVGRDRRLHVIIQGTGAIRYFALPLNAALSAQGWEAPLSLGAGTDATVVADEAGALHLLQSIGTADPAEEPYLLCPNCSDLYYRRSIDGGATWMTSVNLSQLHGGDTHAEIEIDKAGNVHVVWDHGADGNGNGQPEYCLYRRSTDGGQTWDAPVVLGEGLGPVAQVTIGDMGNGKLMVVYRSAETSRVFFQRSDDGGATWGDPEVVLTVRAYGETLLEDDRYSLVADSAGRLHLLMAGMLPVGAESSGLLHLTWNGSGWSWPDIVMSDGLMPGRPQVVINSGNRLQVVWQTRERVAQDEPLELRVWYSERMLDVPAIAPLPFFTPVPTVLPTLTPLPNSTPAPTPLPIIVVAASRLEGDPAWENRGISTIARAMIAVLMLFMLTLIMRNLWRRLH